MKYSKKAKAIILACVIVILIASATPLFIQYLVGIRKINSRCFN